MEQAKIALLALVALLLLIFLIDRNREPAQMKAFIEKMEQAQRDLAGQQDELRDLMAELKEKGVAVAVGHQQGGVSVNPNADGKPKLGENFLLPIDSSHFDRSKVGGTLKLFQEAPKGFNPILENSATASDLHGYTNDSLCSTHPKHPQLWYQNLARSCVIDDDYKTYTFKIRDNVYWHIPKIAKDTKYAWLDKRVKLTAYDFKAYYDVAMNPDVECPQVKAYYDDIESVEALDDFTLQIKWKRKVYTSLASSMGMEPLPRHVYYHNEEGEPFSEVELGVAFNKHWFDRERQVIGVGAYLLDQYVPDKIISLKRNKRYWGKSIHFDRIEWDGAVKDQESQWSSFQNGDAHYNGLPPTKFKSEIIDQNEKTFFANRFSKPNCR